MKALSNWHEVAAGLRVREPLDEGFLRSREQYHWLLANKHGVAIKQCNILRILSRVSLVEMLREKTRQLSLSRGSGARSRPIQLNDYPVQSLPSQKSREAAGPL